MTSTAAAAHASADTIDESPLPLALHAFKVVVEYRRLLEVVRAAARVAPTKSTLSTATCVLLEADASSNSLLVTATNLETTEVTHQVPADVRRGGQAVVSARVLSEYLQALEGEADHILLSASPVRTALHLVVGRFRARLATLPADEFPRMPRPDPVFEGIFGSGVLEQLARRTTFAALDASPDRTLGHVLIEVTDRHVGFVAADGFRFARAVEPDGLVHGDLVVLVPKSAAAELETLLSNVAGEVRVQTYGDRKFLEVDAVAFRLLIRCGRGDFPDYRPLLDTDGGANQLVATVNLKELRSAAAAARAFSEAQGRVELAFHSPDRLELRAEQIAQNDKHETRVQVSANVKGCVGVSVRSKQLQQALSAVVSDDVELRVTGLGLLVLDGQQTQHVLLKLGGEAVSEPGIAP